jgi:hypothetical protein
MRARQNHLDGKAALTVCLEWPVCVLNIVRFMQRLDYAEEGIFIRLRLPLKFESMQQTKSERILHYAQLFFSGSFSF